MLRRRSDSDAGFVAGFTSPSTIRRRWSSATATFWGSLRLCARHPRRSRGAAAERQTRACSRPPSGDRISVDAITNILLGFGWFSESATPSLAVGTEIRMGKLRVHPFLATE